MSRYCILYGKALTAYISCIYKAIFTEQHLKFFKGQRRLSLSWAFVWVCVMYCGACFSESLGGWWIHVNVLEYVSGFEFDAPLKGGKYDEYCDGIEMDGLVVHTVPYSTYIRSASGGICSETCSLKIQL